jgi:hypothetical protein
VSTIDFIEVGDHAGCGVHVVRKAPQHANLVEHVGAASELVALGASIGKC